MSGDVQPRRRKDKKRKREDDESSHGVHITKMGTEDVHLHVHEEHGTGGHWCAKIFFFSLLAILFGLIGLILLENRGLSDLDTPLSESRFSNYFDGWVDERREEHDEHDAVQASIEQHEEHDEPFEEEEDQSEGDDEEHEEEEDHDDDDHEDDDEHDLHGDDDEEENEVDEQNITEDDEEEDEATRERDNELEDDNEDEDNEDEDNEDEDNHDEGDNVTDENSNNAEEIEDEDEQTAEADNTAEDNDANDDDEEQDEDEYNVYERTVEASQANAENDNNDDEEDDAEDLIKPLYAATSQQSKPNNHNDDEDPLDEDDDDDDGTFESVEHVVIDNDAEELLLLQEKARQQAEEAAKNAPPAVEDEEDEVVDTAPSWASSLAVKLGVGVALALVARLVLIRKNPNATDGPTPEVLMKRRLTIASAEETFPEDENAAPLLEDEYSGEEFEIEEEEMEDEVIEYVEEEEEVEEEVEIEIDEHGNEIVMSEKYVPESFEQLNAMYRSKGFDLPKLASTHTVEDPMPATNIRGPTNTTITKAIKKPPAVFNPPPPPPLVEAKIQHDSKVAYPTSSLYAKPEQSAPIYTTGPSKPAQTQNPNQKTAEDSPKITKQEVTHDLDFQPDDEDIDYDDDDINLDDESVEEEEEEDIDEDLLDDEEDASDIDDTDLMNRLEAKYGRLPAREYESDEDPEDPTWTQIKPKASLGGGPQARNDDDDFDGFEQELRRANEEMMRENHSAALKTYSLLSQKYPDQPRVFLAKAKLLDRLAEQRQSNKFLSDALEAYKRYLAFGQAITDDAEYRAAAERCIERMRFFGYIHQAVAVQEQLIERFPDDPEVWNQLVVSYLMSDRFKEAKQLLRQILRRWPTDGFAQVHYGFVLKQWDKDYENAVVYLKHGIASKASGTQHGRFYIHYGEALQRLGRQAEALEVYARAAELKLIPSAYQRSLYNEPNLQAQPFWKKQETPYNDFFDKLVAFWATIRAEGLSLISKRKYLKDEVENLRDTGDWKQFELYSRGQRLHENCKKAPVTCGLIQNFPAASGCRRGQVKFSVMHPGTHVWPHCGPTNCRLRAHLGLVVPPGTSLRVANETRSWREGKFLIFDDSFEHEVWHNGSSLRLVLIVDVWHPDLSERQRQTLTAI